MDCRKLLDFLLSSEQYHIIFLYSGRQFQVRLDLSIMRLFLINESDLKMNISIIVVLSDILNVRVLVVDWVQFFF